MSAGVAGHDIDVASIRPGVYRGVVEGVESGHCTARIEVRSGPGGCLVVDYEAVSDGQGLQHVEHTLLTERALHVAHVESPEVAVFVARGGGVFETEGERRMQIRITHHDGTLTWAWHWGTTADDVTERSRATCRLVDC